MSFRRVVVLVAALAAGAAMAQDVPPSASSSPTPAIAVNGTAAKATSAATPASMAPMTSAASTAKATSAPAPATSANIKAVAAKMGPLSGDPAAGKGKAAVCGACHGIDGNSTNPMYPKLAGQNEHYIVDQLRNFKSRRRKNPIMVGMATPLSIKDMHDIGAYFASQTVKPGVADETLAGPGGTLFRQGDPKRDIPACMSCHGPDGHGNPGPPYPQLAGQHAQYIQKVLTAWQNGKTWGTDKHAKIMPSIAKRLTKKDIIAVASYIEGLHTNTKAVSSK